MTARETIQARIDAQERYDAIEYGRRTLEAIGGDIDLTGRRIGAYERYAARRDDRLRTGWATAQWEAAQAAARELGEDLYEAPGGYRDDGAKWKLRKAKKRAAADLKAAKAAVRAIGGRRQLRLALAA
jgi:hypothetical protein